MFSNIIPVYLLTSCLLLLDYVVVGPFEFYSFNVTGRRRGRGGGEEEEGRRGWGGGGGEEGMGMGIELCCYFVVFLCRERRALPNTRGE